MKETENKTGKARMELVVSMTVFGTLAVFVRGIPLPSGELALYRAVLAALLLTLALVTLGNREMKKEISRLRFYTEQEENLDMDEDGPSMRM